LLVFEDYELVDHFTTTGEDYCPYWEQKSNAIMSDSTIMNNWYYLPELNFVHQFQPRNLLIIDEAHNASEILVDNVGLSFELDKLQLITGNTNFIDDFTDVRSNVVTYYKKFKKLSDFLVDYVSEQERHLGEKELQLLKNTLKNSYTIMNWLKEDKSLREWIIQLNEETSNLKVLPLNASRFADDYLFNHCDKVLLMSATLDYKMTLKELGIKSDEATFITMPSSFPKKNCKIYTSYVGKFTGDPNNYLTNDLLDRLELILSKHREDKGIIHCVSYNIMDFILEYVSTGRDKLIGHNQRVPAKNKKWYRLNNKNEMLESFVKSENGVFVSPSSYEGLDLSNEDVKFQIHCKVPYLNLADKRIEKKSKQDSKWYAYRASLIMTQAIGRGVRSETDTCNNYILDSSFDRLLKMGVVSDYIKERIVK
jgi:Rad3-related DNA helicase